MFEKISKHEQKTEDENENIGLQLPNGGRGNAVLYFSCIVEYCILIFGKIK